MFEKIDVQKMRALSGMERDNPPSAIAGALGLAVGQAVQSPLEKRMTAVRSMADLITKEVVELGEKLGPVLIEKPAINVTTVKPIEQANVEAPLIGQLDVLEAQLRSIKDQLHMLRCRACC